MSRPYNIPSQELQRRMVCGVAGMSCLVATPVPARCEPLKTARDDSGVFQLLLQMQRKLDVLIGAEDLELNRALADVRALDDEEKMLHAQEREAAGSGKVDKAMLASKESSFQEHLRRVEQNLVEEEQLLDNQRRNLLNEEARIREEAMKIQKKEIELREVRDRLVGEVIGSLVSMKAG